MPTVQSSSAGSSGSSGDEHGSDELKVFQEEGEEDANPGSESVRDELQEEKSTLIVDAVQGKAADRAGGPFAMGFSASPFGVPSYLMPHYAAAAYANGSHLPRPFLYGDPLTSPPPPAHMGTYLDTKVAAAGLRPPLYSPLHPTSQYPYSMLGADQLAAWHQASMYHQAGALRAGSPYSLPITSSSLTSPMHRFSPNGLLAHHPGLSPLGHLPQVKQELDARGHHDKGGSPDKQKKESHIKKPLNAFMLYMKEMRPVVQQECTLKESAAINQILGRRWHALTREEQSKYYEKARKERQLHMQLYPGWSARDNYAKHKKKRRKRETIRDGAASMKKCRARYGLDQQEHWCKPCRRKKKCTRVQAYLEKMSEGGHNNNENGSPSDGEDGGSPDSRGAPPSLESPSEQSLTSPAGFSSIPSLGSPSSIASPSTPGGGEDWFRHTAGSGAFKPPAHLRAPVGTDPRDSKNPLSISQLTGNMTGADKRPLLGMT